jgi:PAS domain S-box-containing protein
MCVANIERDARPLAREQVVDDFPLAMILFDRQGRYVDVNSAACRIIGREREELLGRCNWEVFPDTEGAAWHEAFLRVAASGCAETVETHYEAWDRSFRSMLVRTDGGVLCTLEDTTEAERGKARIATLNQWLRTLIREAPIPVAVWEGPEHRIRLYNPAYDELVGGRLRAGATFLELFPELAGHPIVERLDRIYASGEGEDAPEVHVPLLGTDGEPEDRWFTLSWRAIRGADGGVVAVVAVGIEITAQVRARDTIAESHAVADAANRAKDQFLAMLGHELRNPLAPIRTAVELMRLRPGGPHGRPLDIIERQTTHLMRLVDDLLDVSRITCGEIPLRHAPLNVGELIAQSVETSLPLIESRQHELDLHVAHDLVVEGDRDRLVQVFSNLLSNAAKYTPPGGRIEVDARREGAEVQVRVTDDGQGIAPELLPHVFEAFVQSEQDRARSQGGMGLGLAIVRSLVERHGGTVTAWSDGPDRGSELLVRLPAAPRPRAEPGRSGSSLSRRQCTGDSPVREVLLVDDNEDATELLGSCLASMGITVHAAHDAAEALRIATRVVPDLAILDIGLPDVDGHELAVRLRDIPGWTGVRLVALTGYAGAQDRARSAAAGFERHLVKPIDLARLVETIAAPAAN